MLKKSERRGSQWESKVTNEKEKEGGARHLSLECSASSIE